MSIPGWHSMGLYAPPGQIITVRLPAGAAKSSLQLRIGAPQRRALGSRLLAAHARSVTSAVSLASPTTQTVSPFGGLIYVDNPRPQPGQTVSVDIDSAVEAPRFVLGKTTNDQWKTIRDSPGPWAEIQATQVIITIPSEHIRKLDDPEALAGFWDRVLDACADLAAIPRQRPRPERYVANVQISAGYMHSGYPIMTHLNVADLMIDHPAMRAMKREPVWGLFHEMGHNHQSPLWTFEGAGEVTCNLFSRYCLETVCGLPTDKHGKSNPKAVDAYLKSGGDWSRWKSDPFLALAMYDQLKASFGWETYRKVFAEYRQLPRDEHTDPTKTSETSGWSASPRRAARTSAPSSPPGACSSPMGPSNPSRTCRYGFPRIFLANAGTEPLQREPASRRGHGATAAIGSHGMASRRGPTGFEPVTFGSGGRGLVRPKPNPSNQLRQVRMVAHVNTRRH